MKSRPFGVTLLAIIAMLAAIVAIFHTLQFLHILPFSFGPVKFYVADLWSAFLWGINAAIWLWVFRMLWNVDPQGWLFVVALSTLNLIFAFLYIIGGSSFQAMLPAIVINGFALIYGMLPGTKQAFGK